MGRIRALPLAACVGAGAVLVSGASGADPRTPAGLPGKAPPFLGTAVIGDGGLLGGVDAYGSLVDLRFPGPAGGAQIDNPFARQAAGTVAAGTGIVAAAGAGVAEPPPLWHAERVGQRYLPATNVLRTTARVGGAAVRISDAAAGPRFARALLVRARPRDAVRLRLDVNLDLGGDPGGDAILLSARRFAQRDGALRARCGVRPRAHVRAVAAAEGPIVRLSWRGRGALRARLGCSFDGAPAQAGELIDRAAAADRRWIARRRPLGAEAPAWARRMYARALLVLRALTDRRSGASVAGARDHWPYVWPRDAGAAAIALAAAGYRAQARRVVSFLLGLDLGAGARFRGDRTPVADGRFLPGDAAGWIRAAARGAGVAAPRPRPGAWRDRGDYGERKGERGDYLANAIAGGVPATEIRRLFGSPLGLHRRAADSGSGLDSSAAWAVRPFARPPLFGIARRTLLELLAGAGKYGFEPSQDWPDREAWTAPAAWSAWSLAALGDRRAALRSIAMSRRASTGSGTIPERVAPGDGVPRSTTPLGWTHAFALLALRRLYPR